MLLFTSLILSGAAFIAALFLLIRLDHARRMSDYQCNLAINLHARQMSAILKSAPILPGIARPGLVASVTTTRHRLGTVGMAVESMLLQTVRPESVNLYLSNDIDIGLLPESLIRLQDMGLNIHFVPDVGPHTKLIYALERYSNHHVITFDDDFYAPPQQPGDIAQNGRAGASCNRRQLGPAITDRTGWQGSQGKGRPPHDPQDASQGD